MRKTILTLLVLLSTTDTIFSQKDSIALEQTSIIEITSDLQHEVENLLSVRLIKSDNTNHRSLVLSVKMLSKNNTILLLNDFSFSNVKDKVWTLYPSYGLYPDEMATLSKLEKNDNFTVDFIIPDPDVTSMNLTIAFSRLEREKKCRLSFSKKNSTVYHKVDDEMSGELEFIRIENFPLDNLPRKVSVKLISFMQ